MSKNTDKPNRPSGADYPVAAAERSNQEARLKKAAAAGASASKSAIPGLILQPPASVPPSQKIPAPQATLPDAAVSNETAPEVSDARSTAWLANDEILAELQKISAWADFRRKTTKWSLVFLALLVPVLIGVAILLDQRLKTNLESTVSPAPADWYDVDRNVRQGNFEKALAIGEELILKTPQYPAAHERLAGAYLASGNLEKAKEHYAEAFRLFPSEENEKLLSAIEKRAKADKP